MDGMYESTWTSLEVKGSTACRQGGGGGCNVGKRVLSFPPARELGGSVSHGGGIGFWEDGLVDAAGPLIMLTASSARGQCT